MKQEKYLFFRSEVDEDNIGGVGATTGGGSMLMVPASRMTGMAPTSHTNVRITFDSVYNMDTGGAYDNVIQDYVDLTITRHRHKKVMDAILEAINGGPHSDGFVVIADDVVTFIDASTRGIGDYIHPDISACTVNLASANAGAVTAYSGGTTYWSSYGAGAISTSSAPAYEQTKLGNDIISTILIDLTNLACKGDAAHDAIGLAAGGAAYIAKYKTATMGILYKAEVLCLEVPGEGTATITTDIDIAFNASAVLNMDGDASGEEINTGGFGYVGAGYVGPLTATGATADDYIYLVEGDAAATTGVYDAGKLVVKLYGRATF